MKRRRLIFLTILVPLVAGAAIIGQQVFTMDEQSSTTDTSQSPTTEQAKEAKEQDTEQQLKAGYHARQAVFEAQDPEYPDSEKIVYLIDNDGGVPEDMHPADQELWEIVQAVAPSSEIALMIREFEVYFDEEDTTLASVVPIDDVNGQWLFSINYIAVTDFEELVPTIVHEFAHILSLQDSQTTTDAEQAGATSNCSQYLVDEGCLLESAFVNDFYQKFWAGRDDVLDRDRTEDEADQLFTQKPNDYVSAYATTNPVEDFAESFMTFALQPAVEGDSIVSRKINFFYEYNQFADYRTRLHTEIMSWQR